MLSKHTPRKILLLFFCWISKFFIKQKNIILISSKHGFVGNAAAFVNMYIESSLEGYEVVWMGNDRGLPSSIRSASGCSLLVEVRMLCQAKFAIFTHVPGDVSLYLPRWISRINLWHGSPIKYILDDTPKKKSAYRSHKLSWLNQNPKESDYFFSGGPRFDQIMASCTGLPKDKILTEGLPRNEALFQSIGLPSGHPEYCLYAPTFRDKMTQEDRIEDLCVKWQVIHQNSGMHLKIKLHPNDKTSLTFASQYFWVSVAEKKDDINELLVSSTCLVTDYSSVVFDYMILKKPVYMLMDDISGYLSVRGGTYVQMEELADKFDCVENVDQLVDLIVQGKAAAFDDSKQHYNKRFDVHHFVLVTMPGLAVKGG
jgi:CDP-glycerol glycerophosphotransferase (TagB/SpsB family)